MNPTAEHPLTTLLDDIEAKARAATPGPWYIDDSGDIMQRKFSHGDFRQIVVGLDDGLITGENDEYIAKMSPDTTIALVSALRVAREALEITHESCEWCTDRAGKALTHINELFEKEKT